MYKNTVRRVVFVVFSEKGECLERFIFDVERFPVVGGREKFTEFVRDGGDVVGDGKSTEGGNLMAVGVSSVDVEEQLRATIRKLAYCGGKLGDLPQRCTYTVVVELKDGSKPPIGVSSVLAKLPCWFSFRFSLIMVCI